jgi:protein-disulfide isomerase/uncharacterized membrane protein
VLAAAPGASGVGLHATTPVGYSRRLEDTLGTSASKRLAAALVLVLAGAVVSGLLLLQHHGESAAVSTVNQVCGDGATSGCEEVARSTYSKLGGVPLAAIGLVFYASLAIALVLALLAPAEGRDAVAAAVLAAIAIALVVDLVLLALQAFAIKAFCGLCIVTYVLNAATLAALLPARRLLGALRPTLARPDGRLLAAGWLLGTLALGAAVAAADATLSYRAAGRAATILGAPIGSAPSPPRTEARADGSAAPAATTTAAAPPAPNSLAEQDPRYYQEQARLAQEQARKLQETLDDPQKLDRYFADKAAREYEQAPAHKPDLKDVPFKGPASAPVQVVEYSDFLCPYCRSIAGAFASFVPQAGNRVAVFFKNYPLDAACNPSIKNTIHPGACVLAMGGLCAQDQGKFWPYHDKIFGSELRGPKFEDVVRLGAEAGLDVGQLQTCLGSDETRKRLSAQIEEAQRVGVQATPTLLINGKKLPRINDFVQTVDKEAQKLGMPPLPAQH